MIYAVSCGEKTKPIQSQFIRIEDCVMRIAERQLKKQSQFISY